MNVTKPWRFLILVVLIIGIFLRFANLDQKVYSADEVRSILRLSGYSSPEFVEKVFTGNITSTQSLQNYQIPTSERNLSDAIKALESVPPHPPLYHLLTRFWMQVFNVPIAARISSIIFSFLVFPALYWLCLELFEYPLTGWVAMALLAISPFQVLAAQNTTQYSLWTLTTILSSAAILRALRVQNKLSWLIYAITLALGFYTHLFFTVVAFGQGIYVLIIERFKLTKNLISYCLAALGGVLAFSPWILVILTNLDKVQETTVYYRLFKNNPTKIITTLSRHLGHVFVDFFHNRGRLESYLHILIFILIAYSLYFLVRRTPIKVWLFVIILIILTPIAQIVPDLINQSIRSLQARYYLPFFLGIQLSVAYLLANHMTAISLKNWQRRFWQIVFLALLSLGIISGIILSQTRDAGLDDQRGTASSTNLQLAPIINQAKNPLVISEASHSFILAMSYLTHDNVKFQLFKNQDVKQWEENLHLSEANQKFTDIFILYPDEQFLQFIDRDKNFKRESINDGLYKIVKIVKNEPKNNKLKVNFQQ
jgi:uncharacterized membrane protein